MTNTTTVESVRRQQKDSHGPETSALFLNETAIWLSTQRGSRRIYGDLAAEGIAIEWHNFELDANKTLEWSRSFHSNTLELCLNLAGRGFFQSEESRKSFEPLTAFIYAPGNHGLRAYRKPGEHHLSRAE